MKLLRTKLFLQGDHSWASLATASHLDYARVYRKQRFKELFQKDTIIIFFCDLWCFLVSLVGLLGYLVLTPLNYLTACWVSVPRYMLIHKRIVDSLIEQHGVETLNQKAAELVKKKAEDEE